MSIYKDSYETTVGSVYPTKQIVHAIHEAIIRDYLNESTLHVVGNEQAKAIFITGSRPSEANIPIFTHPISINFKGQDYIVTDVRHLLRKDVTISNDVDSFVRNKIEFNFYKSRAVLNMLWLSEDTNQIRMGLSFAGVVYAMLISEAIGKTYALDWGDQTTVAVITHLFYQLQFFDKDKIESEDMDRLVVHTIKAVKVDEQYVEKYCKEIQNAVSKFDSVNDYCEAIRKIVPNVRLKDFNVGMLLSIVKNSWYGNNAKDIIAVSLEHPPTWISLVYTTLNERTYKNSIIFKVADRFGKRGASDEFLKTYESLVLGRIAVEAASSDEFIDIQLLK